MADESKPGATSFGNFTISGGIQNFGGTNSNQQTNIHQSVEQEQFKQLLDLLKAHAAEFTDRSLAHEQIVVIEQQLARRAPDGKGKVQAALEGLAGNVNAGSGLAEAIAQAVGLVVRHWPF